MLISGQRFYFYEQLRDLQTENDRLNKLYSKNYFKKKESKRNFKEYKDKSSILINSLQSELNKYKSRVGNKFNLVYY